MHYKLITLGINKALSELTHYVASYCLSVFGRLLRVCLEKAKGPGTALKKISFLSYAN